MFKTFLHSIYESEAPLRKVVAYQGRFSPPTKAHIYVYNTLCDEFGKQNVYILTADPKVLDEKNPFTFKQKREMLIAAGIPQEKICIIHGSSYKWEVIADAIRINPYETAIISAMGQKDAEERTKYGKYYSIYEPDTQLLPMAQNGYIKIIKNLNNINGDVMNASSVRQAIINKDINTIKQNVEPGVLNWLQQEGVI